MNECNAPSTSFDSPGPHQLPMYVDNQVASGRCLSLMHIGRVLVDPCLRDGKEVKLVLSDDIVYQCGLVDDGLGIDKAKVELQASVTQRSRVRLDPDLSRRAAISTSVRRRWKVGRKWYLTPRDLQHNQAGGASNR